MQFNFVFYLLALVAVVHAAPMWAKIAAPKPGQPAAAAAPSGGVAAKPAAPKQFGCNCAGTSYSATTVANTIARAAGTAANSLGNTNDAARSKFPHTFHNHGNTMSFPLCPNAPLTEFPLLNGGIYTGGAGKGADRVVYTTGGKFCGCIHHTDDSNFEKCTVV